MLLLRRGLVRATYRLQLGPALSFAEALELVPYLRELGVSHLYLSPVPPGAARARRTATTSSTPGASPRTSAARRRCARSPGRGSTCCSTSSRTTWPPSTRTRSGATSAARGGSSTSTRRPAATAASSTSTSWRACASRTPRCSRRRTRWCSTRRRGGRGRPARRPPRRPRRPAAATSSASLRAGVERVWVEKILEPGEGLRDWPVEGTTGYDFMADAPALFVDPAGEAPLTALYAELAGERRPFAEVAAEAKLEQARTTFRPEVERLRRMLDVPDLGAALAALPVYRTYVEPWSGRGRARRPRRRCGGRLPERAARVLSRSSDAGARRVRHPLPADDRGRHGQGRRGHRPLPLRPPARPERGRRRPGPLRPDAVEAFHARELARRAGALPARAARDARPTTPSAAPTCARASARCPGWPTRWREQVLSWRGLNAPLRDGGAPDRDRGATSSTRRSSAPGRSSPSGSAATW